MNWTKENALARLESLVEEIGRVRSAGRHSAEHARWALNTVSFLTEVFGRDSKYYLTFTGLRWRETSGFLIPWGDIQGAIDRRDELAFERDLEIARGVLRAAYDHLERSDVRAVYEGKDTGPESSAIVKVINLIEHNLRKAIRAAPDEEREVQDALETLLIGADVPYSRETASIAYSSKTYKPDFSLERLDLAIEVKLCAKRISFPFLDQLKSTTIYLPIRRSTAISCLSFMTSARSETPRGSPPHLRGATK